MLPSIGQLDQLGQEEFAVDRGILALSGIAKKNGQVYVYMYLYSSNSKCCHLLNIVVYKHCVMPFEYLILVNFCNNNKNTLNRSKPMPK